jgi:hypothetical protein
VFETVLQTWVERVHIDVHLLFFFFSFHFPLPYFTTGSNSVLFYFKYVSYLIVGINFPKYL